MFDQNLTDNLHIFKVIIIFKEKRVMEERGNFACKLPLWGFLWPVWGRSAWLANQKANRWPPSMRLRQTLK